MRRVGSNGWSGLPGALMEARQLHLGIPRQIVEAQRERAFDQAVDGQRPFLPIEARNAEMAQHDGVLRARRAILQLVRSKRNAAEKAVRIELHAMHGRLLPVMSGECGLRCPTCTGLLHSVLERLGHLPETESRTPEGLIMRKTSHRHSFFDGLCGCGQRHVLRPIDSEVASPRGVEQALLHGLFPDPVLRRTLLKSVGAATVLGALSTLLPLEALKAIAQERKPLEKTKLNVGFLPITCAAPLIYGEHLGHYAKEGLEVSLQKIAGIN